MQSYCFEVKSVCVSCGGPIAINAFTNKVFCGACGAKNVVSSDEWTSIVKDNIKEARNFAEGEGQNSKTFGGNYEYSLLFGKQKARCRNCKTSVPEDFFSSFGGNDYKCSKCGDIVTVRKPDDFILNIVPEAVFVAGEDLNQLNSDTPSMTKPDAAKPVLFNCPSCAGNLEVDGASRMITCKFCNSKIYLPDELWHELHPVKTVSRWYVLVDESKVDINTLPEYYDLSDIATDKDGNLYVAGADNDNDDQFMLFSITPEMKVRWLRQDIKYEYEDAGITTTLDGKLLLWNKNKKSLNVYSCADGKDLPGIKGEDASESNPYPFNLKGCTTLISDSDNTMLAIINNTFVRFYSDGTRAPVWTQVAEKGEKPGFFSRLFGGGSTEIEVPGSEASASYLKEVGSCPKTIVGEFTTMSLGYDGYVYMLDKSSGDGMLAKYTREGKQLWKKLVPLGWKDCKPCADKNGNVFVIGKNDKEKVNILRFSEDGDRIDVMVEDIVDGGLLSVEELLGLAPDGTIYAARYYETLKIFAPDMTLRYISKQAKEEDNDKLDEFKKKKSNEE